MLLLETLLRDASDLSCLRLNPLHCEPRPTATALTLNQDYFRIVVSQIYIKNMPQLLKEFVPLVYSSVRFEFGSRKETINNIVDPRKDQSGNRTAAGLLNQHIMNPAPFINDRVDLSLGLFRIKVADHTATVIKLLSSISSAVVPSLALAGKVAEPLTKGVNDLLANKESFVVGVTETFDEQRPLTDGYRVLITNRAIDPEALWVRGGQLYYGDDFESAFPYDGENYLLYRIDNVSNRTDYRSLESVKPLYEKALSEVMAGNGESLTATYKAMTRAISSSIELTIPDIKTITVKLKEEFTVRWENQKQQDVAFKSTNKYVDKVIREVTEEEFQLAQDWTPT